MGFVKVTKLVFDGVETKFIHELEESEILDIELDIFTNAPSQLLCTVCRSPIQDGIGFQCEKHKR